MRNILIISTTFFPDPAVAGIRMTQWCRNLPDYGWKPHVLSRNYGFRARDEELAATVHPDVQLAYLDPPSSDPGESTARTARFPRRLLHALLRRRGLSGVFVPDPSVLFWRKQRQQILEAVRAIQPAVIVTTGPPHGIHEVGLWLSSITDIPWLADFRDPYLIDNRFQPAGVGRLRCRAHQNFEQAIYRRAAMITHAIPFHARWARRAYPFARARIRSLTNGFPLGVLDRLSVPEAESSRRRSIRVAGTILDPEQWQLACAVERLVAEGEDLELQVIGRPPLDRQRFEALLGHRFVATGYVSHSDSIELIASASVLVNFLSADRSASWLMSTKMFEYLATGLPVVAVNPSRPDRMLLRRMPHVRVLSRPSAAELSLALRTALGESGRVDQVSVDRFRREFSWPKLAAELGGWLDELADRRQSSA